MRARLDRGNVTLGWRVAIAQGVPMSHVPYDLASEFPDDGAVLHALKLGDAHFRALAERHHETNREIHRIETSTEAASDARLETLKKQRLAMLDEVARAIAKAKVAAPV
jgi:uncharacterized protein YdcH (DUF465 family)